MDRRIWMASAGIALGLGMLGGAVVLHRKSQVAAAWPSPGSMPSAAAASSLEELARRYPNLKQLAEDPKVGSVLKEFAAAYNAGGIERAKAFARERGFMNSADDVTLTLLTERDDTTELEGELAAQKAQIVRRGDGQLDVLVPWSVVEDEVKSGRSPEAILTRFSGLKNVRGVLPMERQEKLQIPFFGKSQASGDGVGASRASAWHAAGFKGAGVKIGILDPEVSKAPKFLGDTIPRNTPVYMGGCVNAQGLSTDDDGLHGVAATEIVHAMAPDAQLYLACSLGNDDAAIQWLLQQGVRIISYSAGGLYGPRNGRGRSQDRINRLTSQGILWVNAAGNDGHTFHRGQLEGGSGWHQFAPGKSAMGFRTKTVDGTVKLTLIWSQWDAALVSDYDLVLFDSAMNEVARSEDKNTTLRQPMETINARLKPGASYFVGVRGGATARSTSFVLNVHNASSIEYLNPSGSLGQPADAAGALAVGAVVWNTNTLAPYSSRGPTEDGRRKPEISAPTEISSRTYKGNFAGTSSAAPHVAGAAALVWGRFPNFTRDQVASFLLGRARDLGPTGPDNDYGTGMLDLGDPATAAGAPPRPTAAPTQGPPPSPTGRPPSTPGGGDDEGGGVLHALVSVLLLAAVGGLVLVGGIIALAVSLLRGRNPKPAAAPQLPAAFPPGGFAPRPPPSPFFPAPPAVNPGAFRPPGPVAPPGPGPGAGAGPGATVIPGAAGAAGSWMAALVVVAGPGSGQRLSLRPGTASIGRSPGNQIVVPDSTVSSRHAWLDTDEQGCWIRDAGSINGLFVNGQRVQRHFLMPGDVITIGPAQLRFEVQTG